MSPKLAYDPMRIRLQFSETNSNEPWQTIPSAEPWRKYFMAVWASLECFVFGGLVFGWPSLVFILKKEGIYADLCPNATSDVSQRLAKGNATEYETTQSCPSQDERLNLAFTIATTLMTSASTFMGHLQFKCGTRVARIVLLCFLLCGTLIIAFLDTSSPYLIFIGLSCVAIGGLSLYVTNIQVANLFAVGGSTVVGVLAGSVDISATVQLLVKISFENGISRRHSYLFLTGLLIMVVLSSLLWLPKTVFQKSENGGISSEITRSKDTQLGETTSVKEPGDSSQGKVLPSLLECVLSKIYLSHIAWISILQLRFYFFLGSMNAWLFGVTDGDNSLVSHYTNVSLFIQLGGILTSPLAGFVFDLERKRNRDKQTVTERRLQPSVLPTAVTSILAILLSVLVLIPSKEVLYLGFIILTLFRSFMYGIGVAFVQMVFPPEYFSFMLGLLIGIAGAIGFLQYPLFMWMEAPSANPSQVNIFLLILMLLSIIQPLHIWWTCRSAKKNNPKSNCDTEESEYSFISKTAGFLCCRKSDDRQKGNEWQ